ncbi:NIPSNAP family protein [soil metagenome]
MITCYLRYVIDPDRLEQFEAYAKMWIPLVEKFGGIHHGYFLPHEGANNIAMALFSFPTLTVYEKYRAKAAADAECQTAVAYYKETKCFISFECSFMRPVFRG